MSREQDAVIAEWRELKPADDYLDGTIGDHWFWSRLRAWRRVLFPWGGGGEEWTPAPFSTDLNAMAEAEALLPERGLVTEYMFALCDICVGKQSFTFRVATATAPQRATALVRVIEANKSGGVNYINATGVLKR